MVPGFLKPHQTLLGVQIPDGSREVTLNFKQLLCRLVEEEIVTTAKKTWRTGRSTAKSENARRNAIPRIHRALCS